MEKIEKARIEIETSYNNMLQDTQAALEVNPTQQAPALEHQEHTDPMQATDQPTPITHDSIPAPETPAELAAEHHTETSKQQGHP